MKTTTSLSGKQISCAKKIFFFALILTFSIQGNLLAQKRIVLQHNGLATAFSELDSCKAHLQSGDTIYFPGAGYTIGEWVINKRVTIFGAGHYPDSTVATGTTYLIGSIRLLTGADNTFIQGIYLTGNIAFGSDAASQTVNNFTLSRCSVATIYLSYNGSGITASNNIVIRENNIRGHLYGGYATGVLVTNNILNATMAYFSNALFKNNIILGTYCNNSPIDYTNNNSFQNNVFILSYCNGNNFVMLNSNTNDFQNNAFSSGQLFPDGSNTGSGNWINIDPAAFFVNFNAYSFSYTENYHLKSPATYVGNDAKQIGIYGSAFPYKEGAVPINPHIQAKTIAPTTNTNGELNINIKVAAQNY
ncbi:MAG: hypothetical protein Q7U54_04095 [Bacteroidales bacterium]|nr:hypothetical protein [Bacteroidales bacterium]